MSPRPRPRKVVSQAIELIELRQQREALRAALEGLRQAGWLDPHPADSDALAAAKRAALEALNAAA